VNLKQACQDAHSLTCVSRPSILYTPILYTSILYTTTPGEQVDDFAEAQRTPLPEYVAGIEGDKV